MELLSLKEASQHIGLKPDTLRLRIARGKLHAIQPSGPRGKLFISTAELERLKRPAAPHVRPD